MKHFLKLAATASLAGILFSGSALARDQIRIVGSSTVFPFATAVAEQFGQSSKFKTPVVESTGSGGGMKLFCSGVGLQYPDVANASRRIKKREFDLCTKNNVTPVEVKVGFDGIVLATSKKGGKLSLTKKSIFSSSGKICSRP